MKEYEMDMFGMFYKELLWMIQIIDERRVGESISPDRYKLR